MIGERARAGSFEAADEITPEPGKSDGLIILRGPLLPPPLLLLPPRPMIGPNERSSFG